MKTTTYSPATVARAALLLAVAASNRESAGTTFGAELLLFGRTCRVRGSKSGNLARAALQEVGALTGAEAYACGEALLRSGWRPGPYSWRGWYGGWRP